MKHKNFTLGGFCLGFFCLGGFCLGGLSRGICPRGFVQGVFVLEPIFPILPVDSISCHSIKSFNFATGDDVMISLKLKSKSIL